MKVYIKQIIALCLILIMTAFPAGCSAPKSHTPTTEPSTAVEIDEKFASVEGAFDIWYEAGIFTLNKLSVSGDGSWTCTHETGKTTVKGSLELSDKGGLYLVSNGETVGEIVYDGEWDRLLFEVKKQDVFELNRFTYFYRQKDSFSLQSFAEAEITPDMLNGTWYPEGDRNADHFLEIKYGVNWTKYIISSKGNTEDEYGYIFQNGEEPQFFEAGVWYDRGGYEAELVAENILLWGNMTYYK